MERKQIIQDITKKTPDREQMAIEFKSKYKELCDEFEMEIAFFDSWDHSLIIYDRKEKNIINKFNKQVSKTLP